MGPTGVSGGHGQCRVTRRLDRRLDPPIYRKTYVHAHAEAWCGCACYTNWPAGGGATGTS